MKLPFCFSQIAQQKFCSLNIFEYICSDIPYLFFSHARRAFALTLSGFRNCQALEDSFFPAPFGFFNPILLTPNFLILKTYLRPALIAQSLHRFSYPSRVFLFLLKKASSFSARHLVHFFILFIYSSCAQVAIHDHELCGDKGFLGAACYHTETDASEKIPKPQWDDRRFGQICTTAEAIADWKQAIEKLCTQTNECTYDVQKQIQRWSKILDAIEENK